MEVHSKSRRHRLLRHLFEMGFDRLIANGNGLATLGPFPSDGKGDQSPEKQQCTMLQKFSKCEVRAKNEFLFQCGKGFFLPIRFYVKSILARFESQKQPF